MDNTETMIKSMQVFDTDILKPGTAIHVKKCTARYSEDSDYNALVIDCSPLQLNIAYIKNNDHESSKTIQIMDIINNTYKIEMIRRA